MKTHDFVYCRCVFNDLAVSNNLFIFLLYPQQTEGYVYTFNLGPKFQVNHVLSVGDPHYLCRIREIPKNIWRHCIVSEIVFDGERGGTGRGGAVPRDR